MRTIWLSSLSGLCLRFAVLYVLVACVISTKTADSVDPNFRRMPRSHEKVKVYVDSSEVYMRRGDTISVTCTVVGGIKVEEMPIVSFYRQFGNWGVMPLSSSSYGIALRTVPSSSNKYAKRIKKHKYFTASKLIRIYPSAYDLLLPGDNHFYCQGRTLSGRSKARKFVIKKV